MERVDWFEAAIMASMARDRAETSSFRYQSKSIMKSVMLSWCVIKMNSVFLTGVTEFWVENGVQMMILRHLTWR